MKACGIIAEYNPFHNGHAYQLKEARKETEADVIIVVMSGNFLQRGEPAIIDKWSRAELAIKGGADLVVELPVDFSVQPADVFAEGAVAILNGLNCEVISFGSESGNSEAFKQAAEEYLANEKAINEAFKLRMKQSDHYAKNFSRVLTELYEDFPLDLSRPNNVLGFSYAKEVCKNEYPIDLHTVKRLHSEYDDEELDSSVSIGSATAIRKLLASNTQPWSQISQYVPESTLKVLESVKLMDWDAFFPYLRYQITVQSVSDLQSIYLMEEGLHYRFKDKIDKAQSMTDFLKQMKTKQLTWTRLQRICYHILMNNKKRQMNQRRAGKKAVRLLAFNSQGQKYMNENKERFKLTLVSNIRKKQAELFSEDIRAGLVYKLASGSEGQHQDYYRKPVKLIDN